MKGSNPVLFVLLVIVLCMSCNRTTQLSAKDYIEFCENEKVPLVQSKEFDGVEFRLKYLPVEYSASKSILSGEINSVEQLKNYKLEMNRLNTFVLELENRLSNSDVVLQAASTQSEYLKNIEYMSYYMDKDIYCVVGSDTLPCSMFHYENSYGGIPVARFMVGFEKPSVSGDISVVLNDKLFSSGFVKFHFKDNELRNIPELVF